jgi:hypothetical protein
MTVHSAEGIDGSASTTTAAIEQRWSAVPALAAAWEQKLLARRNSADRVRSKPTQLFGV